MTDSKLLSVIIVTHNNETIINNSLTSLKEALKLLEKPYEIIVVDNASQDKTIDILKKQKSVNIITSSQNKGYAWANNQGLIKAQGKYILLLNSDVLIEDRAVLKKMINYLEKNKDVGVVSCEVVLANGKIDPACHRGFPTPWAAFTYFIGLESIFPKTKTFSQYHMWYKPLNLIHEIDSCSGAFYLFRKEIVKTVGLLDEAFFMYGEDLDYSYRIKKKGYKVMYNPEVKVLHFKYQSGLGSYDIITKKRTVNAFYDAMVIFYKKHYVSKYPFFVTVAVFALVAAIKKLKLYGFWLWN